MRYNGEGEMRQRLIDASGWSSRTAEQQMLLLAHAVIRCEVYSPTAGRNLSVMSWPHIDSLPPINLRIIITIHGEYIALSAQYVYPVNENARRRAGENAAAEV